MAITQSAEKVKKELSKAWIDCRKALDLVPHSWITEVMESYKVCPIVREITKAHEKVENKSVPSF